MKRFVSLMLVFLFGLIGQSTSARSMTCGTHLIEDGQINGPTRAEVEEKCGAPDSSLGNDMRYTIDNVRYRLHFSDGNELESITEEME